MKKLSRIAALLAASAMLFGFAACSDSDSSSQTPTPENQEEEQEEEQEYTGKVTTGSWDFTQYADAEWTGDGVDGGHQGSKITPDTAPKNGTTQYLYDGQYYLTENVELTSEALDAATEDGLTLTLLKTGTGVGSTQIASSKTAPYSYKYGTVSGLRFKNDSIEIADVKGKVKLTIEWSSMQNKDAGDRNLEVTVGDSGTTVKTPTAKTDAAESGQESVAMTPYTQTINAGSGKTIYIGASNNLYLKTITIESAADAVEKYVTVKFPDFEAGLADESKVTSADYSIGYDDSISADDLTAKVKADTTKAELPAAGIELFQKGVDEALTDEGAEAGAVTVTADDLDFIYFASAEDWNAYDGLGDDATDDEEKAALEKALSTIEGGATVYITIDGNESLWTKVANAIEAANLTLELPYTITASKFTKISDKTTAASTTPTSDDATTSAIVKAIGLALGESMRIDGNPLRFNVGGSLQEKGKNAIIFTAPTGATSIEVHFYNNGESAGDRYLQIAEYSDSNISATDGTKKTVASSKDDIVDTFAITAGKKYMLGASNGLYITEIVIKGSSN